MTFSKQYLATYDSYKTNMDTLKHPIKWKIYWLATKVYDWGIPIITPIADFIRDKTWEHEDHQDL